jgi:hypothetical protein
VLPPPLTRESQTRRGKDNPSMFVTPTAGARRMSATTNSREYAIIDDVATLLHANPGDWNARSCRTSTDRHTVEGSRELHRSFGAGPRRGLSCDHSWWTNAGECVEFTLRFRCSVSKPLAGRPELNEQSAARLQPPLYKIHAARQPAGPARHRHAPLPPCFSRHEIDSAHLPWPGFGMSPHAARLAPTGPFFGRAHRALYGELSEALTVE